jgi:TPR repeat protein
LRPHGQRCFHKRRPRISAAWIAGAIVDAAILGLMPACGGAQASYSQRGREAYEAEDFARARALYARGCHGGDGVACGLVGVMYENGRGGPKDLVRAREA